MLLEDKDYKVMTSQLSNDFAEMTFIEVCRYVVQMWLFFLLFPSRCVFSQYRDIVTNCGLLSFPRLCFLKLNLVLLGIELKFGSQGER